MELILSIINTFILLALFWYQKNKNKLLSDRITEQSKMLRETKDVVTNQAQAIDSQKKVVESALEYSKAFDFSKIESIIKREANLEYQQRIKEQEEKINKHEKTLEKYNGAISKSVELVISDFVVPLTKDLLALLYFKSEDEREKVLSNIPISLADQMKEILKAFDENAPQGPGLLGALMANNAINKES